MISILLFKSQYSTSMAGVSVQVWQEFYVCFVCFFITSRRWGQSTSYNVAHPGCGHKYLTLLSPGSRLRVFIAMQVQPSYTSSTLAVEVFVLTSSRFPLRKPEEKFTPVESRPHKFRLSGHMLYPLVHGGSPCEYGWSPIG